MQTSFILLFFSKMKNADILFVHAIRSANEVVDFLAKITVSRNSFFLDFSLD